MQNFIGNNINAIRINKGLSQEKFAMIAGVSQSAVSAWERGESTPHYQHIESILNALPELVADDILSEELGFAKKVLQHPHCRKQDVVDIPLFGSIAAGEPLEMLTCEQRSSVPVPIYDEHPKAFYLKVEGESMNRTLPNGCYALIDPALCEVHDGKVYAISVDGTSATIKRLHLIEDGIELQPDSYDPSFEPMIFNASNRSEHTLMIIGQAIWFKVPYGRKL